MSALQEIQPATEFARVWTFVIAMNWVWPSNSELPLVETKNLALAMADQYSLELAKTFATSAKK